MLIPAFIMISSPSHYCHQSGTVRMIVIVFSCGMIINFDFMIIMIMIIMIMIIMIIIIII